MNYLRLKFLLGIHLLIFLTAIIQSCCVERYRITSYGKMCALEPFKGGSDLRRKEISTIKGDFILEAFFHEQIVMQNNISLVNSCYATSCSEIVINTVDVSTLELSINKSCSINNNLIPANSNLLKVKNSGIVLHSIKGGCIEFRFTDTFFSNLEIENGSCTFRLKGLTNDGIELETETSLAIELL